MEEVAVKTHLIITDIHEEFHMNWCGKIFDAKPKLQNGLPVFTIIGSRGRIEISTIEMSQLEKCAKSLTYPRGRSAVSKDSSQIYIQEIDGNEKLIVVLTHRHVKSYAPMFDKVGFR